MQSIPQAIRDTVLNGLVPLFLTGAGGDPIAARHAAAYMLVAYNPVTPDELSLASEIVSFSFHALQALSDASNPELSLNKILRLRGSAVSLSRESHKAQRKLDHLQRARHDAAQAEQAEAPQPAPKIEKPINVAEAEPPAAHPTAQPQAKSPPQQSFYRREADGLIPQNRMQKPPGHLMAAAATAPAARPAA